jgi:hypothetical protein
MTHFLMIMLGCRCTGRKSYNFPTSHHAARKTKTLTPAASSIGSTALLIWSNPPPLRLRLGLFSFALAFRFLELHAGFIAIREFDTCRFQGSASLFYRQAAPFRMISIPWRFAISILTRVQCPRGLSLSITVLLLCPVARFIIGAVAEPRNESAGIGLDKTGSFFSGSEPSE